MNDLSNLNFDSMTPAEFEAYLPELFETGKGSLSTDPRLAQFFAANPDCAELVRDLEAIAAQARSLFEPGGSEPGGGHEPSDAVWSSIASKLGTPGESE